MKRYLLLLFAVASIQGVLRAQTTFDEDDRSRWECAYPYTSTNCQAILIAYRNDRNASLPQLFDGYDCAGCDTKYVTDHQGTKHPIHSICVQPEGAEFTQDDFLQPITIHKESNGGNAGWNVVNWEFKSCFRTWKCNRECSLASSPPTCIVMRPNNWGLYEAQINGVCSYGNDGSENQEDDETPPETDYDDPDPPRDDTWNPVH